MARVGRSTDATRPLYWKGCGQKRWEREEEARAGVKEDGGRLMVTCVAAVWLIGAPSGRNRGGGRYPSPFMSVYVANVSFQVLVIN
jgi:hypothetical protein